MQVAASGIQEVPSRSEIEFVPHLRLRRESLLVDTAEGLVDDFREVPTAVIELSFDYGGASIGANDPRTRVRRPDGSTAVRDVAGEAAVRRILEGFGPVDLDCLDDCALIPGSSADYAVHLEGDPDVLCAFGTFAIPRMRQMGWQIVVEEDYPCHVVQESSWYANLGADDDERGWFELELGVDVDGQRVDLLPVLLDLIESRGSLDSLARTSRRVMALPLGESRYLAVPPQRLRMIAKVLRELYEIDGVCAGGALKIPTMVPEYLDQLDDALAQCLRWEGDTSARKRAKTLSRREPPPPVEPPRGLQATLRPYQREGLAFLQNLRAHGAGGILADDMGLGKTLQTIAHIVKEKEDGRQERPSLVIAPTSLVGNWAREIEKFAPFLRVVVYHGTRRHRLVRQIDDADVVITTYGLLLRDRDVFESRSFYLQILDEAQTIKNARSQAHKVCKSVDAEYRLCLSGTPVENNLEELWSQFDFLMPGLLGDAAQFRTAFRYPIERDGNRERLETLRDRVAPFVLRRMKDKVAGELPPKTEIVRPINLRGGQRDLYESIRIAAHSAVRKAVKKKGLAASTIDILGALMKLRQVCCDPRLVNVKSARDVDRSAKFEALFEMVPDLLEQGRRILIFSQFTSMLALIGEELRNRRISHVSLTGATANRQAAVDAFQSGSAKVFLISLKAGGTGLNLTAADTVIHYDPWWNPAAQAQATDRAYRIGQQRPVFVYNLIVAGSVEERMLNLQRRKQALADGLLADQDHGQVELSQAEVDDLFAPLK
jgi:superfamily II DNA or RNA helicase